MQDAQDAPGADNGVSNQGNGERSGSELMMEVVQEAPATTDSVIRHQELQATVEDGPNEETQRVGNESGPVDGMPILQERFEETETIPTDQSQPTGDAGIAGINTVNPQERNTARGSAATSLEQSEQRDTMETSTRPERSQQSSGGPVVTDAAASAVALMGGTGEPSQPSTQQVSGPAILAPPISSDVTSASQSAPVTTEPPVASTAQPTPPDIAPQASHTQTATQTKERTMESDRPSIPIEHTRQPYSSQPSNARFGPAATSSGSVASGQGSAGAAAAARGMPMCK